MTVRLIVGPPGAGKNHYVEKNAKPEDYVLDLDELKESFPDLKTAKDVRKAIEASLKGSKRDAWVIRCAADAEHRQQIAERCGADEVVVIATPAEVAKQRIAERETDPAKAKELSDSIDHWWSHYSVVQSDLIVKPDTGNLSDKENNMPRGNNNQNEDGTNEDENNEGSDKGFPADTPVNEMTVEQQVAYWKFHSRKHENQAKSRADYDQLKTDAEKWRAEQQKNKPADQVAAEEAAAEAEKAIRSKYATKLVAAEFKGAVAGRMSTDDLNEVLEDMDLTKYLTEDGDVDTDRVAKKASIIAPEVRGSTRRTSTHQSRRPNEKTSSVTSGRDLYAEIHGKNKK